jgi:hypothetical protein
MKEENHSEDVGANGRIILKGILKRKNETLWTEFTTFNVGTHDGILRMQ